MEEFRNEFSWSKSRDGVFGECRRKYYFNHYGFWGGWDSGSAERTKRIYYLKKLSGKEVWLGSLVHEVIEFVLRKFRDGEAISLGHALAIFRARFDDGFLQSSLKEYTGFMSRAHKFFEDEYGIGISDEDRVAMLEKGELCLTNFFNSDVFMEIRRTPVDDWITLEDFLSFDFEGTRVFLSVDFAMRKDGKILLYDWKTGRERIADVDLQLSCYALYFAEKFGVRARDIEARVFNLALDKVDVFDVGEGRLEEMKGYIRKSVEEMKGLLDSVEDNVASEERFERWFGDEEKGEDFVEGSCGRCAFRKVCLGGWGENGRA
jgi:hypothetical protein